MSPYIIRLFFFNGVDLDNRIELLYLACDKYKRNNGLICGSHHLVRYYFTSYIPCVSRNVAFIIKNIDMIILFACLVGWLNSSPLEIKKNNARF